MAKLLLPVCALLILGAISMSKEAGYSSSDKSGAPAIRKFSCGVVEGKKPWCACRSSISSETIDLSSLGKNLEGALIRDPKFRSKNNWKGWHIAWTPCEDFDMFTADNTTSNDADQQACKGVGFARYTEETKVCYGYGSHEDSAKFYSNGHDIKTGLEQFYIEFYIKTNPPRHARIWLDCNQNSDENSLQFSGDKAGIEVAHFSSKCCCPNQPCSKSQNHDPKPYRLSAGMIAGISVAAVAIIGAIIVAVVIYKRRKPIAHPVEAQENDERRPILGL